MEKTLKDIMDKIPESLKDQIEKLPDSLKDHIEKLPDSLKDRIEGLPGDVKEKAKSATSLEDLKEILSSAGHDLTDEELDAVSGGCSTEVYGDVREDFDSSRMSDDYLSGEDLGF